MTTAAAGRGTLTGLVEDASACAGEAAARAGVEVVLLDQTGQFREGAALLASIWGTDEEHAPVSKDVLRAFAHSGNYVAGAFFGRRLVGMSVAFAGQHDGRFHLHSHISGVAGDVQQRRIGFALKQHQRAWALQQGFDRIVWTFDPLVRRNAYFNLAKLGAAVTAFHPNFYGRMEDGINAGDESDRALVEWSLAAPAAVAAARGESRAPQGDEPSGNVILRATAGTEPEPLTATGPRLSAWVPPDIVQLRQQHPQLAMAWRRALRATLGRAVERGYTATGMTRSGWYELERTETR